MVDDSLDESIRRLLFMRANHRFCGAPMVDERNLQHVADLLQVGREWQVGRDKYLMHRLCPPKSRPKYIMNGILHHDIASNVADLSRKVQKNEAAIDRFESDDDIPALVDSDDDAPGLIQMMMMLPLAPKMMCASERWKTMGISLWISNFGVGFVGALSLAPFQMTPWLDILAAKSVI